MNRMVQAILRHHGFEEEVHRSPHEGVANEVWLGRSIVVRIAKDPEYLEDFYTESVAAPAVFAAGIPTPRPLVYDASKSVVPAEYSILEFAPGNRLADLAALPNPDQFFGAYGAVLRTLHDRVVQVDDPNRWLDEAWVVTPASLEMDYPNVDFGDLLKGLEDGQPPVACFVHQDLHAENILVHEGRLSAILDWGDAGWGDPAADLRFIPIRWMAAALEGYGPTADSDLPRRIALHALDHFLDCQDDGKNYGPYGSSSWDEVVAFIRQIRTERS